MHYPDAARNNNIEGKVIVSFVVEKDGKVTDVKATKYPDQSLKNEAIRIVSMSPPWHPALEYGIPVRVQFTVPVIFSLTEQPNPQNQLNTNYNN